jgi:hypothetical protein
LDFFAVILAAGAVIEVWNKGSIFSTLRAKLQATQDVTDPETLKGRALELLFCPFCQSYHVPFWLLVLLLAGSWAGATINVITHLVVYSLAATRLVNMLDGFLPPQMRHAPSHERDNLGKPTQ